MEFEPIPRPCEDADGELPSCAPLAVPYVPFQQNDPKKYTQTDALANGTLIDLTPEYMEAKLAE